MRPGILNSELSQRVWLIREVFGPVPSYGMLAGVSLGKNGFGCTGDVQYLFIVNHSRVVRTCGCPDFHGSTTLQHSTTTATTTTTS